MADYSRAEREEAVKRGEAMPDKESGGKFPIKNASDLHNAIEDYNRIPAGEKPAVKRHIIARARALGLTSKLPADWHVGAEGVADDVLTQDTGTTDLGTQSEVLRLGSKTSVRSVDRGLADDGHRKKKREDPLHIVDEATLGSALRAYRDLPESDKPAAMGRIVNRARQLRLVSRLPKEWNVTQEDIRLSAVLVLDEAIGEAITQEAVPDADASDGVMRIKVPFYIGNSVARTAAFKKPILFPSSLLPQIVEEGTRRIAEGKMPLTVYARHAHAMSAEEMPIGKIVALEHDNRVGRAVIDIVDDGRYGTQTQRLIKAKMLNAVSLRSEEFELEDAKVNGQMVLEAKVLQLAGIDFAPDGPAQPTFGIEVLAAEAVVEHNPPPDEEDDPHMEITLERVRAEAPAIVQEIERPLREQITSLTAERDSAITERDAERAKVIELEKATAKSEADAEVAKLAAEFPQPAEALKVLQEKCKDCANAAEVKAAVAPILLDALKHATKPVAPAGDEKPAGMLLAEMFGKPRGQVITQDATHEDESESERVWGLAVPD